MSVVYQHNGSIDNLKQLSNILLKAINFSAKIYLFCAFVEPFSCHCKGPVKLSRGLISFQWALSLRVHLGHPQDLWDLVPRSDWTVRPRESWQVPSNTESPGTPLIGSQWLSKRQQNWWAVQIPKWTSIKGDGC